MKKASNNEDLQYLSILFFCCFVLLVDTEVMYPRLASKSLCSQGLSWTSDLPDSTSQVVRLQAWATMSDLSSAMD